jgi:hypothetical protein
MSATAVRRRPLSVSWWDSEQAVALRDVPDLLPPRPGGKATSLATVRRWVRTGVCGIRLRVFAAGPTGLATTAEEVRRFVAALSAVRGLAS